MKNGSIASLFAVLLLLTPPFARSQHATMVSNPAQNQSTTALQKGSFLFSTSSGLTLGSRKNTLLDDLNVTSETKFFVLDLEVNGGILLGRSFVLGGVLGAEYAALSSKNSDVKQKSSLFRLGPYGRIFLPLEGRILPYADLLVVVGLGSEKTVLEPWIDETLGVGYFGLGMGLGASFFVSDRFAIDLKFAYDLGSRAVSDGNTSEGNVEQFTGIKTGFVFLLH